MKYNTINIVAILSLIIAWGLVSCSTEEPQRKWEGALNGASGSDNSEEEDESLVVGTPDGESDHLFKYANPNIYVSPDGIIFSLAYEPVKCVCFFYLVCRDVLAENGDTAVRYIHDWDWYYNKDVPDESVDGKRYPHFAHQTNINFFSSGDVVGLREYSYPPSIKKYDEEMFIEANVKYEDWVVSTDMEVKAGEDDWVTALIDKAAHTVTFTIKPNDSGESRCFTFAMGGVYQIPPFEFLDNGVIVHQAAR